jgi:hypothetical protein
MSTSDTPIAALAHTEAGLVKQAFLLANRAVVSDIMSEAHKVRGSDGRTWWDTRPMLDVHEHDPLVVDMARQAIDYALAAGLVTQHAFEPHLVRIVNGAEG